MEDALTLPCFSCGCCWQTTKVEISECPQLSHLTSMDHAVNYCPLHSSHVPLLFQPHGQAKKTNTEAHEHTTSYDLLRKQLRSCPRIAHRLYCFEGYTTFFQQQYKYSTKHGKSVQLHKGHKNCPSPHN